MTTPLQHTGVYDGLSVNYLPGTKARHMLRGDALLALATYLYSIVLLDKLKGMLARGFWHIDGWLEWREDGSISVQDLNSIKGRKKFDFFRRQIVGREIRPDGPYVAVVLPADVTEALVSKVTTALFAQGVVIPGKAIAAAVVHFPGALLEGGNMLRVPPHPRAVRTPEPIGAVRDPHKNQFVMRVIQVLYRRKTIFGWRITARVGLSVTHYSVPEGIHDEVTASREGRAVSWPTAEEAATQLVRWASTRSWRLPE